MILKIEIGYFVEISEHGDKSALEFVLLKFIFIDL